MDYPKKILGVGLHPVTGKFWSGDVNNPPSRDTPEWANGVTDELINVIKAANLVPDELAVNQLLAAINVLCAQSVTSIDLGRSALAYTAAQRPFGVTQYNTSDKPRIVMVVAKSSNVRDALCSVEALVDGAEYIANSGVSRGAAMNVPLIFPVRAKGSYRVNLTGPSAAWKSWVEFQ